MGRHFYSLMPLDDFKAVMGVDDREDKIARFCLVTSTFSIEQFCKRRLLRKKHIEYIDYFGDLVLPLKEYPVVSVKREQVTVNSGELQEKREKGKEKRGEVLDPRFYRVVPDLGSDLDIPYSIELSPVLKRMRGLRRISVVYVAGYSKGRVPADLASACLELASWNMNRYRGRRIGMTGNVRGTGRDGEHFEMSMPVQVRELLESYRRKVI